MLSDKRAIGVGTFVTVVIILIIAVVVVLVSRKLLMGTHETFTAIGPGLCAETDQQRDVEDFREKIVLYAARETKDGISYYDPQAAIEQYRIYLSCKEHDDSMIRTEGVEEHEPAIRNAVKTALINVAEDLCEEHSASVSRAEQKSIEDAYFENLEYYYSIFPGEDFKRPYGCEIA